MSRISIKTLLLLALVVMALVSPSEGAMNNLRKLSDDGGKDDDDKELPKAVTVTHLKGKDGKADEVDIDLKVKTCKKDSKECDSITGDDDDIEDVSLAMFTSLMSEEMVSALEKDEGDDRRELEEAERNLRRCRWIRVCKYYRYRYCNRYRCWIIRIRRCRYIYRC